MKKIIAFILLVCLFFNLSGYHLFFYLRKQELKTDMKEFLRSSAINKDIEQFVFSLDKDLVAGVEWEGENEFRLNGEMYDVVEKKVEDNKIVIRCISDKKETALLKKYEKINHEDNSKSRSALLVKLISSFYLSVANNVICINNNLALLHISFQQEIISSFRHDVLTPPPQS